MIFEQVHAVWEFSDGIRTGIADLDGSPHYFASRSAEAEGGYSDNFRLYPVTSEFLKIAVHNWHIFQAWERKFQSGKAELTTHPGRGGIDAEYDELQSWLNDQLTRFLPLPMLYTAVFRELANQEDLPAGVLREVEVAWSPSST